MAQMNKRVKVGKKTISVNAETMYLRLLAINAKKQVSLQRAMAFENSPIPLSIFSEDGSMVTGVKSQFLHKLEELVTGERVTKIDECDIIIFDCHAIIQMMSNNVSQLANQRLKIQSKSLFNIF